MTLGPRARGRTPHGLETLFGSWIYGLAVAQAQREGGELLFALAEAEAFKHLLGTLGPAPKCDDAVEAAVAYVRSLDSLGLLAKDEVTLRPGPGGIIEASIGECPFRHGCTWMNERGMDPPCSQAGGMSGMIEMTTGRPYRHELKTFGRTCEVVLRPLGRGDG